MRCAPSRPAPTAITKDGASDELIPRGAQGWPPAAALYVSADRGRARGAAAQRRRGRGAHAQLSDRELSRCCAASSPASGPPRSHAGAAPLGEDDQHAQEPHPGEAEPAPRSPPFGALRPRARPRWWRLVQVPWGNCCANHCVARWPTAWWRPVGARAWRAARSPAGARRQQRQRTALRHQQRARRRRPPPATWRRAQQLVQQRIGRASCATSAATSAGLGPPAPDAALPATPRPNTPTEGAGTAVAQPSPAASTSRGTSASSAAGARAGLTLSVEKPACGRSHSARACAASLAAEAISATTPAASAAIARTRPSAAYRCTRRRCPTEEMSRRIGPASSWSDVDVHADPITRRHD